jgi:hypothetical protein
MTSAEHVASAARAMDVRSSSPAAQVYGVAHANAVKSRSPRGTGISGLGRLLRWTHALRYEEHSREGWARAQRHAPGACV